MGTFIEQLGQQVATGGVGAIMGMALSGWNDERQKRQQEDLQNIQIRGSKELTDYNMAKQLQMWKDTNYAAQLEQMKKAGLSPGLIYGMKGGGGVTTGQPNGSVSGASAPQGGGEILGSMGMAMNLELMKAQKEVMESQAKLNNANADKTAGVDTGLARTQIMLNTAGVDNVRAQTALNLIKTKLGEIDAEIQGRTIEDSVRYIGWAAERTYQEMVDWRYKNNINEQTWQMKIEQVRADLVGTWLRNALTQSQTNVNEQQVINMANDIVQKWRQIEIQGQGQTTNERRQQQENFINDVQKSTGLPMEILREAVDGIFRSFPKRSIREGYSDKNGGYWEESRQY
ncbi:MAG: DNA pilot protein [Microviridae sp.]|nr:MAG: DNA pilot protein [Microviridae sp.]